MKKVLFVSWQGGMGHITRDVAIVKELHRQNPGIEVSWISHPLGCGLLRQEGETILPESDLSADYNQAIPQIVTDFRMNVMKYLALTGKTWAHNADLFKRIMSKYSFDLVIGDESYEIMRAMADHKIQLKCKMILIEDLVGVQAMSRSPLEKFGAYLRNRRLASRPARLGPGVIRFFVGELDDVPDSPFGFRLPNRRQFAAKYYEFLGYVIRFNPAEYADRTKLRKKLGYGKEPLLICATGGLSAGKELLELCGKAYAILKRGIPDLRMVAVCGELFGTKPPDLPAGVELHNYVPDLYKHYAACDMAVVVGGGTTTVELTALRRPFAFFPLENQFDQQVYIADRLARQGAGIKMRFFETTPETLADVIKKNIGKEVSWPPIRTDGAETAAKLINQMLAGNTH
jgi:UDP-N-acetylglucosamine:LPS N-acetylglucosamine transferase